MKENLDKMIMQAMKSGDKARVEALRGLKAAFTSWETAKENVGKTLDEATEISVLKKLVAQYRDTAQSCNDGKHDELVQKATMNADILSEFLPKPATEEDIRLAFRLALEDGIEPIKKNMGLIIKTIKMRLPNADGKLVSTIVSKNIN